MMADEVERVAARDVLLRHFGVSDEGILEPILRAMNEYADAAEQRGFKLCQDAAVKVAEGRAQHAESLMLSDDLGVTDARVAFQLSAELLAKAIRTLSIKETGNGE